MSSGRRSRNKSSSMALLGVIVEHYLHSSFEIVGTVVGATVGARVGVVVVLV